MIRGGSLATIGWRGCTGSICARFDDADSTVMEMVAKNPGVAMAHVYRWRYVAEFLKSGAAAKSSGRCEPPPTGATFS